ncbi:MAG: hypothetical protein HZA50_00965 [Planctomycetes bacterium]|nr:hypothetical protein [Planctomycetota bacterium]
MIAKPQLSRKKIDRECRRCPEVACQNAKASQNSADRGGKCETPKLGIKPAESTTTRSDGK